MKGLDVYFYLALTLEAKCKSLLRGVRYGKVFLDAIAETQQQRWKGLGVTAVMGAHPSN